MGRSGCWRLSRISSRLIASSVRRRLHLRVHLLQGGDRLGDSQQREQIRQRIFQRAVQDQYFAGYLLLHFAFIILEGELEVIS